MDYQQARQYMLGLPEAWEDFPFGPDIAVMKIKARMFATLSVSKGSLQTNLKCDPHEALMLRDIFDSVIPGYHMNKQHWNTVILDGDVPRGEIERMQQYDAIHRIGHHRHLLGQRPYDRQIASCRQIAVQQKLVLDSAHTPVDGRRGITAHLQEIVTEAIRQKVLQHLAALCSYALSAFALPPLQQPFCRFIHVVIVKQSA